MKGERLFTRETGAETDLFPEIEKNMKNLTSFIEKRKTNQADPKSIAFYERGLNPILSKFEEALPVRREELKSDVNGYSQYYVSPDGQQQIGPLSADDMIDHLRTGKLAADHLAWHAGMPKWKPFSELMEYDSFKEIVRLDEKMLSPQKEPSHSRLAATTPRTQASAAKTAPQPLKI